jgi:hypothetical protein
MYPLEGSGFPAIDYPISSDRVYLPEQVGFAFWVVWAFALGKWVPSGISPSHVKHAIIWPANCSDPPAIIISSS